MTTKFAHSLQEHRDLGIIVLATSFVHNLYGGGSPVLSRTDGPHSAVYGQLNDWIVARNLERAAIAVIKAIHTVIFLLIMSFIVHFAWSGLRNRLTPWTVATFALVVGEGIVLGVNGGRCPLTVVVEDLGSNHGSVSDIFLPDWVARHIPHISSALIGLGVTAFLMHRIASGRAAR